MRSGDFQAVFDLKSAYYHVRISERHKKFLGACIPSSSGSPIYFVYNVLLFGLNSAVHVITKIFKPILSYLSLKDVRMTIYIDDVTSLFNSAECRLDVGIN
jgi:hypothetical protein